MVKRGLNDFIRVFRMNMKDLSEFLLIEFELTF